MTPARLTSPKVGMSPTMPQSDAGPRIEPPVSEPSAAGTNPAATAAPEPLEEPPVKRHDRAQALRDEFAHGRAVIRPALAGGGDGVEVDPRMAGRADPGGRIDVF